MDQDRFPLAKVCRPWQDSNLQSPVSETDALSIRPQGRGVTMSCIGLIQEVYPVYPVVPMVATNIFAFREEVFLVKYIRTTYTSSMWHLKEENLFETYKIVLMVMLLFFKIKVRLL